MMKHKYTDYQIACELEEKIYDALGADEFLQALIRAMSLDDVLENYRYIIRMYDLEYMDDEITDLLNALDS